MINLSEKVVLVTGASRGIGAASARILASAGANVILHYGRSLEQAQALADQIGPRASLVQADLSKPGAARGLWQDALVIHGRIDVLVNNAGILFDAPLEGDDETWARAWQEMLQVNLIAVADLCREAIATFPQNPGKTKGIISSRLHGQHGCENALRGLQSGCARLDPVHRPQLRQGRCARLRACAGIRAIRHGRLLDRTVRPRAIAGRQPNGQDGSA
jgi:NAD(P)-dependent dehydrogenase (short-subunit alcohol dehydrogenase family)